jgi:hypothetical protein
MTLIGILASCATPQNSSETAGTPTFTSEYQIGDFGPGSGYVFFIDSNNEYPEFDYLEVAPKSCEGFGSWMLKGATLDGSESINGAQMNTEIGKGKLNTNLTKPIPHLYFESTATYFADNSACGGIEDWFLPSSGELHAIAQNLIPTGKGEFGNYPLLSSNTTNTGFVFTCDVYSDFCSGDRYKTAQFIRPVRSF